ncbi:hypothetical protein DAI22_06g198203 [Oryza sativa Japonica Group]|nr:hypothetical protein DAI22_06g198203 [Oryza sativa Japonica Group]
MPSMPATARPMRVCGGRAREGAARQLGDPPMDPSDEDRYFPTHRLPEYLKNHP